MLKLVRGLLVLTTAKWANINYSMKKFKFGVDTS